ncbi:hypothetical protein LEP1GSC041_0572 [Leptospira noguchii str. 2006001870]|uniref:hypothetical protein n=1 Tax=Leptospira noguchii TaxID=28182 RepID=UPI00029752ED|nr:hypothetical protein [Leptospira noguchii]EKR71821.1 hypothetical protein LEP1GSC041_0572 [Leptospira noguchii str. 2006001870]
MIVSEDLEKIVRELEKKGYRFIYIEDYIKGFYKGYFKSKIKIARNMLLKGTSLEFILSVTKLTEQELKDYGVI